MSDAVDLGAYLDAWAGGETHRGEVASTVMRLSEARRQISCLVGRARLPGRSAPKQADRAASSRKRMWTSAPTISSSRR